MTHRVELGRCSLDGFEPYPWGTWDENDTEELRQSLISIFYGEIEAHETLTQREWPEEVISFMDLEELPKVPDLDPLVTLEEKASDEKRRYLNQEGHPCQGIYRQSLNGSLLLLANGQLIETRKSMSRDLDSKWEGCLAAESLGPWIDEKGSVINFEAEQWSRVEAGRAFLTSMHFGLKEDLIRKGLEADDLGWESEVFPHISKENHFRLICWNKAPLKELLDEDSVKSFIEKYPDVSVDWNLGYSDARGELLKDDSSKAGEDLRGLMEGVPAEWVLADIVD